MLAYFKFNVVDGFNSVASHKGASIIVIFWSSLWLQSVMQYVTVLSTSA
jgi:hypothetical protein